MAEAPRTARVARRPTSPSWRAGSRHRVGSRPPPRLPSHAPRRLRRLLLMRKPSGARSCCWRRLRQRARNGPRPSQSIRCRLAHGPRSINHAARRTSSPMRLRSTCPLTLTPCLVYTRIRHGQSTSPSSWAARWSNLGTLGPHPRSSVSPGSRTSARGVASAAWCCNGRARSRASAAPRRATEVSPRS